MSTLVKEKLLTFFDCSRPTFRSKMITTFRKDKTSLIASRVKLCGTILWAGSVFIGFLLFVSLVLPSLENNGYVYSMCNVTKFLVLTDSYNRLSCKCPVPDKRDVTKCVIYYPCLQIFASFVDSLGELRQGLVVKCRRHVGENCSQRIPYYDCSTENAVYKRLKELKDKYGRPGTSFSCYYKANQPGYILLTSKQLLKTQVLNLILWPCLGAMVGFMLMMYNRVLSMYYCGYKQKRTNDAEDLLPLADNMDT
ncbi:uncharacterized protein LOC116292046 [Actinia tenebrosa]|uniref:Uncharacterized protein LOC116292046 n=1 Tax=Actinia tenebrosa TaxID=6105 RepID=A0A6P8HH22_ACTTE|nr:uncharacterized protein LOC116292046 [Actinia tenebrosa]